MAKPALGKGLSALIHTRIASPTPVVEAGERVQRIALTSIIPSPLQPRTVFRDEELQELVDSIKQHGIIQPLICRQVGEQYELIAGERRWRAARQVGLADAPVIVRAASDRDVLELALIENLQRANLNPIEEAHAFTRLASEFSLTQEEIAYRVGKSRASIANSIRLLDLADQVQSWVTQDRLSVGHAKVLLSLKSRMEQEQLADQIVRKGLTVRQTEQLVSEYFKTSGASKRTRAKPGKPAANPATQHLENRIRRHLGTQVALRHSEKRGTIEIEYYGSDDLDRLLSLLGIPAEE